MMLRKIWSCQPMIARSSHSLVGIDKSLDKSYKSAPLQAQRTAEIITIHWKWNWVTSSTATCSPFDSNKEKGKFLGPIGQIQQTAFDLRFCVFNVSWSSSLAIKERFLRVKLSMLKVFVASALRPQFDISALWDLYRTASNSLFVFLQGFKNL